MGTIYVLRNRLNGKCYVGQTILSVPSRILSHKKTRSAIGLAILKYGIQSFDITKLQIENDSLDECEIKLIRELNSMAPNGYNLSFGGQRRRTFSAISRERMRLSHLGKKATEEQRRKQSIALLGKPKSPDARLRMSEAQKGHAVSESTKKKLSSALMGHVPWNKGMKASEEHRRKNRDMHIGRKASPQTRAKMSASQKGKNTWSRGRKQSEEYKRRMSDIITAVWARKKSQEVA